MDANTHGDRNWHIIDAMGGVTVNINQRLAIVGTQRRIQAALLSALREQLTDVAGVVGFGRSASNWPAGQGPLGSLVGFSVQEGVRVGIDEHLDWNAKLAAILQCRVVLRDPGRAGVHIGTISELGPLRNAAQVCVIHAPPHAPATSAGPAACLKNFASITSLLKLVRRSEAGVSSTEDEH